MLTLLYRCNGKWNYHNFSGLGIKFVQPIIFSPLLSLFWHGTLPFDSSFIRCTPVFYLHAEKQWERMKKDPISGEDPLNNSIFPFCLLSFNVATCILKMSYLQKLTDFTFRWKSVVSASEAWGCFWAGCHTWTTRVSGAHPERLSKILKATNGEIMGIYLYLDSYVF